MTRKQKGNTKAEYAIIIALVAMLGIAATMGLGGSVSNLFQGDELSGGADKSGAFNMTNLDFNGPGGRPEAGSLAPGTGYYSLQIGPDGVPRMVMQNGNGMNSNATSVEGSDWNVLGGIMLAQSMLDLAAKQEDPAMQNYLQTLADKMFYMAGAESELDGVPYLSIDPADKTRNGGKNYSKGNALQDINRLKNELMGMLNDPRMQQLSPQDQVAAMAYGTDAYNIGQEYVNALAGFIGPDGRVPKNFGDMSTCDGRGNCHAGNSNPGSTIQLADRFSTSYNKSVPMNNARYEDYFNAGEVRQKAMQVLQSEKGTTHVNMTINDGTLSDQLGQG